MRFEALRKGAYPRALQELFFKEQSSRFRSTQLPSSLRGNHSVRRGCRGHGVDPIDGVDSSRGGRSIFFVAVAEHGTQRGFFLRFSFRCDRSGVSTHPVHAGKLRGGGLFRSGLRL